MLMTAKDDVHGVYWRVHAYKRARVLVRKNMRTSLFVLGYFTLAPKCQSELAGAAFPDECYGNQR